MTTNSLWIDLTDLLEWRGHFTGIQRVTYNYAARFAQEGARFFIYSSMYGRFIEVPFRLVEQVEGISKRKLAKQKLRAYYLRLPVTVRTIAKPLLHFANKVFRKVAAILIDRHSFGHALRKFPEAKFAKRDVVLLLGAGWNSKGLIESLAKNKEQLGFSVVLHLNDILPIYQPYLFAEELPALFESYVHQALSIADTVTVISNATKQDVVRYCKEKKLGTITTKVIRLGEDIVSAAPEKPAIALGDSFILCVGTLEIRKNYILLYQVIKLAQQLGNDVPQIVIAGRKGWLTHDLHYMIEHDVAVADRLVLIEKASDANLSWLYEHCMFTVFCSIAEGWGLPIAESLRYGKFCLSSNTSSMPEVAKDTIDYFSPFDPKSCLDKIVHYAAYNRYTEKNAQIKKNYRVFTWDASFRQYKKLISNNELS